MRSWGATLCGVSSHFLRGRHVSTARCFSTPGEELARPGVWQVMLSRLCVVIAALGFSIGCCAHAGIGSAHAESARPIRVEPTRTVVYVVPAPHAGAAAPSTEPTYGASTPTEGAPATLPRRGARNYASPRTDGHGRYSASPRVASGVPRATRHHPGHRVVARPQIARRGSGEASRGPVRRIPGRGK